MYTLCWGIAFIRYYTHKTREQFLVLIQSCHRNGGTFCGKVLSRLVYNVQYAVVVSGHSQAVVLLLNSLTVIEQASINFMVSLCF